MAKRRTLGESIRALRLQNGMTQLKLADWLGVTDKAVSKWERDLSFPDVTLFPKLADILGVTVDDLLQECIDEGQPSRLLQIFRMSHDVRTPLHIMLGCVNLAEMHSDDPDQLRRYLESIRVSGEYLLKTLDRIMRITFHSGKAAEEPLMPSNDQEFGQYLNERIASARSVMTRIDFSGKRFLVAEDIRLNREIADEILRQSGAEVDFAEDGEEALERIETAPAGYYDLILMDIMMPHMDGLEATRQIRSLPEREKADIPIIAVSANVYEKDQKQAYDAGMNGFAEKPIFVDALFAEIERCLNNRNS